MLKKLVLTVMAVSFVSSVYAAKISEGFEDKAGLKKMEIEGDVTISADQKHGGKSALFVPAGATATFRFNPENAFGTVTMWVYDSCVNNKSNTPGKNWNGPYFGLINSDDDKAVESVFWRAHVKPSSYSVVFTAENQWFNQWNSGFKRAAAAWNKFIFKFTDEKTLGVTFNDDKEDTTFPTKLEFFNKGANGITIGGGVDIGAKNETLYYDDLEIDLKDAVKAK